jgi:hypothetical protein
MAKRHPPVVSAHVLGNNAAATIWSQPSAASVPGAAQPTAPCPCKSGLPFVECHGVPRTPASGSMMDLETVKQNMNGLGFQRVESLRGTTYKDSSTVIIIPTRDPMIHHRVVQSWQNLIAPMNQRRAMLVCCNDEVGHAYNTMVQNILNDPSPGGLATWKYVMTLESDNLPPPDAHIRLLETIEAGKFDGVSGLYFTKGDLNMPMCYGDAGEYARTGVLDFKPLNVIEALKHGNIVECCGIAMGCSLYRMELFREIAAPWFVTMNDIVEGKGVQVFTQDLNFCQRAKQAGKRFAVDMRVRVGHLDIASGVVY